MIKKMFIGALTLAIGISSFTIIGASSASAASSISVEKVDISKKEISRTPTEVKSEGQVTTFGVKGFLVKLAIKSIEVAIDKGGDILNYILKWFDKETASYIKKNTPKIVKALDKLEDWIDDASDLAQSTIKTKLNSLLRSAGVPSTYSLAIADAIARTITWLTL